MEGAEYKKIENSIVFYLKGKIEIYHIEDLRNYLLGIISDNNPSSIIFKFKDVDFIDSSGLGLFLNLQFTQKDKCRIFLCSLKDNVKKVFEYTKLDSVLNIAKDEKDCFI